VARLHDAVLAFEYDSPEHACRVERAIRPELDEIDGDRSGASVDRTAATLTVTVEASDLTALRAGLTTWTGLVTVAERAGGLAD
jgi:KEOPS complex subunit Pcc1